jgi:hypothetical protein
MKIIRREISKILKSNEVTVIEQVFVPFQKPVLPVITTL